MNKFSIIVISLALSACTNSPDFQAGVYSKGERIMLNGVIDYEKQNYLNAQQKFYRALLLYQSVDDSEGTLLARINLVEALLATHKFEFAEQQLIIVKQLILKREIKKSLKFKVNLLEVKVLYQKQHYHEALDIVESLLIPENNKRIDLLAIAAKLEVLISVETEQQWLNQFRATLLQEGMGQSKFHINLKRIDAVIATQNKQFQQALELLHEALVFYKSQANRRSIAACLEEIAEISLKQNKQVQALEYFNRALAVRVWLKDQYHIDKIQKTILQIKL